MTKYFFKEYEETPLCRKGFYTNATGHVTFEVKYGVAELPAEPPVEAKLTGKAKIRAERHRQLRLEAQSEAIRELGGVLTEGEAEAEAEAEAESKSEGGKS